ncbi:hypothetical protein AB0F11_03415 [Streptomyces sp. NPDC032472]|uniref:hypothetical protein n=1 Tax=Streptomyces sp. NPDC032472 TaxID=3155018 RepID=UPI0033C7ACB2
MGPAYGASTVQAAAAPADDRTVHCPKASYDDDYTPCANADFLLEPGATLLVHTTPSSDDITVADFAVFEPGGGPKFPIREVEYVELSPFKPLLTNQEKST